MSAVFHLLVRQIVVVHAMLLSTSLSFLHSAPERFQARVGKHFLEKIWRKVSKKFSSLYTLVFCLPTLDLIKWVDKDHPAII